MIYYPLVFIKLLKMIYFMMTSIALAQRFGGVSENIQDNTDFNIH